VVWTPTDMDDATVGATSSLARAVGGHSVNKTRAQRIAMLTRTPDLVLSVTGIGGYPNVHIRDETIEFVPAMLYCKTTKKLRLYNNGSAEAMVGRLRRCTAVLRDAVVMALFSSFCCASWCPTIPLCALHPHLYQVTVKPVTPDLAVAIASAGGPNKHVCPMLLCLCEALRKRCFVLACLLLCVYCPGSVTPAELDQMAEVGEDWPLSVDPDGAFLVKARSHRDVDVVFTPQTLETFRARLLVCLHDEEGDSSYMHASVVGVVDSPLLSVQVRARGSRYTRAAGCGV